ncbi:hypothetical protein EGM88_13260 [Aureibaculum marinum]|uniref:Lipoprotein n=1 Tax=Aureibaculum marinum TaxID=2487930 RepID=A0A3N4NP01_9FLAO|nr:hypothetical protein [Aureibaculum marinum]RPD93289.1 hypothetical protein EGM88_13260 [Aureibaculum marinum]
MQIIRFFLLIASGIIILSCSSTKKIDNEIQEQFYSLSRKANVNLHSVESFLKNLSQLPIRQREDSLIKYMSKGWMPAYNFQFKEVSYTYKNAKGKKYKISFWVSPDYLSIGTNQNFVRMPLTPQTAQKLADQFHSVLPTTKMVNKIYEKATIKLSPIPLTENRDSLSTFVKHHFLIQQQLKYNIPNGIVAGIKKDVVQSNAVLSNPKPNRVAIYGWHKLDGKPIQPLYTGHVDWYVDYSHGIRLVYEKMLINNQVFFVKDVLNNSELSRSICDEGNCRFMRYNN